MEMTKSESINLESKILTIPNILSFFRICLIPLMIWLYLGKDDYKWTGYILILSGVTDIVDGFIARQFHMISNLGKVLDPIADKLTQASMLICLMMRFPLMSVPLILMFMKELFMSMSGMQIIKQTGIVLGAKWHGKAATILLYAMMFVHVFWNDISTELSNIMIFGCVGMIFLSFILYTVRNLKILRQKGEINGE